MIAGYLYAMPGTRLTFDFAEDQGSSQEPVFQLRLEPNSSIFLDTGDYRQAYLLLKDVDFILGSCLALQYSQSPLQVLASCYSGSCKYSLTGGQEGQIQPGTKLLFAESGLVAGEPQAITESEARQWAGRLTVGSPAYNCAHLYIPTPTPHPRRRPQAPPHRATG